jgi:hypothetical protein
VRIAGKAVGAVHSAGKPPCSALPCSCSVVRLGQEPRAAHPAGSPPPSLLPDRPRLLHRRRAI